MDREQIERECRERATRYYEELEKHREFIGQFASIGSVEPGKPIESPKRALDTAAFEEIMEAEKKLDKLRQEMKEACNRL
jgi:Cys-tRNA synthase (O-phospho-L-seryl-tRNA:Cys-tRNA synthase)